MCVANDYVSVRIRATDYIEKWLLSTFMQVVLQVRETQLGKNLEDSIGKRLFTGRYYLPAPSMELTLSRLGGLFTK